MPNYPTSLDSLANPLATTRRNDPGFELHTVISTLNDIVEALEAKLGTGGTAATAGSVLRGSAAGVGTWDTKLLLGAGSATAPTYGFDGDPNTGAYSVAADVAGVAAGGELVAQFKRTGAGVLGQRVGSGTFSDTIGGDGDLFVKRGLNVGSASGAATGEVRASGPLLVSGLATSALQTASAAIASSGVLTALNVADPIGVLFVSNSYDGQSGFFMLAGGNPISLAAGAAGTYSTAFGTSARANVYRDAATHKPTIQNNLAGTATFYCVAFTNALTGGGIQ